MSKARSDPIISNDDDVRFLHTWQKTNFSITEQEVNSAFQADKIRNFIGHINYAIQTKRVSDKCGTILAKEYLDQYVGIIDSEEPSSGLNNYADGALLFARHMKSEVPKWKSGLTSNSVLNIKSVKQFIEANKAITKEMESSLPSSFKETFSLNFRKAQQKQASVQNNNFVYPVKNDVCMQVPRVPDAQKYKAFDVQGSIKYNDAQKLEGPIKNCGIKRKNELEESDIGPRAQPSEVTRFRTARDQLAIDSKKKNCNFSNQSHKTISYGSNKKSLGARRVGVNSKFIPPLPSNDLDQNLKNEENDNKNDKLDNIDPKMIELIKSEIMDHGLPVSWDDIAGLEFAKKTIKEIVVWPMLRPDIFTGLRGPPKGILLFGPPGTGKTLIGKCIASQSKSTFFSISASSLTSKWVGDGEKMVRALFTVASCHQPAVIFIDEIDSLLQQRSDVEHESSRRIKTEFLVQLDGATTSQDDKILVIGATNRPQELDEAARRRLVKRLYIPLPEILARKQIIENLLAHQNHNLLKEELDDICQKTEGYSGADMTNLCREAALGPIRSISFKDIESIAAEEVRPIIKDDFLDALHQVKASVSNEDLQMYVSWNSKFGSTCNH